MRKVVNKKDSSVIERRFGVILESIDSNVKHVVEGHAVLDEKIEDFRQEFNGFRKETNWRLDIITKDLSDFKKETKDNFGAVFKYLSEIDAELRLIKIEINDLKTKLDKKTDRDRLEELEKRVKNLEEHLAHAYK